MTDKHKFIIEVETYENPDWVFNALKYWLSDNLQNFKISVAGDEKLKYELKWNNDK